MLNKILITMVTMVLYSFVVSLIIDKENYLHMIIVMAYSFLIGMRISEIDSNKVSLDIKSLIINSMKLIVLKNNHLK